MATQVDPLRSTLDRLVVDPAASTDRPYLESMLRRLGYSDVEIQAYLGARGAPPAPAAAPHAQTANDEGTERDIELEYTGPGLREYAIVIPADTTEFAVDADGNPLDLGAGLTAGEEVLGAGPSMDEVDALMEKQDLSDFGDFAGSESEVGKLNRVEGDDFELGGGEAAEGDTGEFTQEESDVVEFAEKPPEPTLGEPLVEFKSNPVNIGYATLGVEPPAEPLPPEPEPVEAPADSWGAAEEPAPSEPVTFPADDAGSWAPSEATEEPTWAPVEETEPGVAPWAEAAPAPEPEPLPAEAFHYGDWTLYSRDVDLSDGRRQMVYFFSRGEPADGQPAPMPEGYEVTVNDRTGLPYLRRIDGGGEGEVHPEDLPQAFHPDAAPTAAGRKRVRMKRVRAESREAAEEAVRQAGGDVLTSVPVDIEERWDS